MQFFRKAAGPTASLGVFPGTFNPVTVAHLALAQSALQHVDEVVFVLPRVLPHKAYSGASFAERILMLETVAAGEPRWSIAATDGGLFAEIADECGAVYGVDTRLSFLCGRDAAERIASWDYGRPGLFAEMLNRFGLLVAPRQGQWPAAGATHPGVRELAIDPAHDAVSASEVRRRIAAGEPWEHLVPPPVCERVRQFYGPTAP